MKLSDVDCKYGAPMGRRNTLPSDSNISCKIHLNKLKWVDGDYDQGGAYWGSGNGDNFIYWGYAWKNDEEIELFIRASNRKEAKEEVRKILPNVTFYN